MLLGILNFSPTERYLTHLVEEKLTEATGGKVHIESIEVGLFNRLMLNGVRIEDLRGETLLQAGSVSAKIELRSLFREQLALRTVSLLDADVSLYKQRADSAANYQFLVDAFSSKDKKESKGVNLRVNSVILRRVNVAYNEWYTPQTKGRFNLSHLNLRGVNANVSLKSITTDGISLRIRSLALREGSGLQLDNLHFILEADKRRARLRDFALEMPHSHLAQDSLVCTYDASDGFSSLLKTLSVSGGIRKAKIASADLRPLLNLPQGLTFNCVVSCGFAVNPQKIRVTRLSVIDPGNGVQLNGSAVIDRADGKLTAGKFVVDRLSLNAQKSGSLLTAFSASQKVKDIVCQLGEVNLHGAAQCRFAQFAVKGNAVAQTAAGRIEAEGEYAQKKASGHILVKDFCADRLLQNEKLPSHLNLTADVNADLSRKADPMVKLRAAVASFDWNKRSFRDITLDGAYSRQRIEANVVSNDPAATFQTRTAAVLNGKQLVSLTTDTHIDRICLSDFGIDTPLKSAKIKGTLKANLKGLSAAPLLGYADLSNVEITDAPRGGYSLNSLRATISPLTAQTQQLALRSDFLDADVTGKLSLANVKGAVQKILSRTLPALASRSTLASTGGTWEVDAAVKNTDILKFLGVDVSAEGEARLQGRLSSNEGEGSSLTFYADKLHVYGQEIDRPSVYANGADSTYNCLVQATKTFAGRNYRLAADLSTRNGQLLTRVGWQAQHESRYNGAVEASTRFFKSGGGVGMDVQIQPTTFLLADSLWHISSGRILYDAKQVAFDGVHISHADQALTLNGEVGPHRSDSIVAVLQNIDVDYILGLVNFNAVSFGGQASGRAIFTQDGNNPQVHANLHIPAFLFNDGLMGDAYINGNWNKDENRINLYADMTLPETAGFGTHVDGYVSLAEKGLLLNIKTTHTRLDFLKRYMDGIFGDFGGNATGDVCLYGPFKKLDFKGEVEADCQARVLATGVKYCVSDGRVKLSPGEFAFENFTVSDSRGGTGTANGALRHTHLKQINYDFDIVANRLLCYDQPKQPGLPFYSTAVGTGQAHLAGYPSHFAADIALTPDAPTTFTYDLGEQSTFSKEDKMVHFHAVNEPADTLFSTAPSTVKTEVVEAPNDDTGTDIVLNLVLNANPSAQLTIITDARTGDAITARGNGLLRATWRNKGAFEMYGTYTFTRGQYKVSLQDIIRKDLTIQPGSTITFTGNPLNADLGIKTLYTVNGVSLSDLNYVAGFSNKTVRADCIMNIGGKAANPQVDFDLNLHNISEDEKQMVRQLISTEEDMSKQVICLLGVGRFFSANTGVGVSGASASANASQQQSSAAMRSFLSTTLTNQLNSAISSVLGSQSKWSFGTNLNPGSENGTNIEVDGLLQGRLFNDRLLINGNFGYRDHPNYTSNFVGDFDIRYLLTPKGSVSLRAYSETNNRYFTKSSLTTQGVGISLQRDFTSLRELFSLNRKRKK